MDFQTARRVSQYLNVTVVWGRLLLLLLSVSTLWVGPNRLGSRARPRQPELDEWLLGSVCVEAQPLESQGRVERVGAEMKTSEVDIYSPGQRFRTPSLLVVSCLLSSPLLAFFSLPPPTHLLPPKNPCTINYPQKIIRICPTDAG